MAKELVGQATVHLQNTASITHVRDVKEQLKLTYPALQKLPSMAIAVNVTFAQDQDPVTDQDEIAVIPPVSGG